MTFHVGQKVKKFLGKSVLALAFISAANGTSYADVEESAMAPETCAANSNLWEISQKMPQLSRDLALMERLPLTGKPVFDMLKNPAHKIRSCLFSVPKGDSSPSTYQNRLARIARDRSTSTSFHEDFHAWQDINSVKEGIYSLSMRDAIVDILLNEAAAVSYEMASRREAENHGLQFFDPAPVVIRGLLRTTTYSIASA